jgi:hypothetical protein|tara:strand:- start:142 stop:435 length:294 start_codon:yes stop_codon:yes gene_type:complete
LSQTSNFPLSIKKITKLLFKVAISVFKPEMVLTLVTLIGDNMKRVGFILGLIIFTCILMNSNLLAHQTQIQIIGQLSAVSGQSFVQDQEIMEANAIT